MTKLNVNWIEVSITKASTGRFYYSPNSWRENTVKLADGSLLPLLSNKQTTDVRDLPKGSITTALLPATYSEFASVEELQKNYPNIPTTIKLDTLTGKPQLI